MAKIFQYKDGAKNSELFQSMVDDLDLDEDGLKYKHVTALENDFTLCGLAWGDYIEGSKFKSGRITCPDCLSMIAYCKGFKAGRDYSKKDMLSLQIMD